MPEEEKLKGLLTHEQCQAVFGLDHDAIQRLIRFDMPVEIHGGKKYFNLLQTGQWLIRHYKAGYLNLNEAAELFGVEPRTITKFTNEYGMPKAASGFYKTKDIVLWREKYLSNKLKTLQQGGSDGVSANTKLKTAQAKRQELRLQKESGSLVEIDKVRPVFDKLFSLMAQRRKLFSKRTNPQLDGIETFGEREKILNDNVDELFNDIYESGIRELARLQQLSGGNESIPQAASSSGTVARKRVGKKKPHSKSRNRKRTLKI